MILDNKDIYGGRVHLNTGTLGHVDHGKTTLTAAITKVLSETFGLSSMKSYEQIDKAPEEKARGITINATVVEYSTPTRHYGHTDCPGHADFIKNMITGASQLDGAILVVSLVEGVKPQTKEHVLLAQRIGIKKLIVCLNKADLSNDEELEELVIMSIKEILELHGFDSDCPFIKLSALKALEGDKIEKENIIKLVTEMDNYFEPQARDITSPLLLSVEGVLSKKGRGTVITGKVCRGIIKKGEEVEIVGIIDKVIKSKVSDVETFLNQIELGSAGDNVGVLLSGVAKNEIQRGMCVIKPGSIKPVFEFIAHIYVLKSEEGGRKTPFSKGYRPQFYIRTADITGLLEPLKSDIQIILPGDMLDVKVKIEKCTVITTGLEFAIREGGKTVAVGKVI
jgi:elongation factor Tu